MTKRELIDQILQLNHSARPEFLARFPDGELDDYLQHLERARTPRLSGAKDCYDKYFANLPKMAAPAAPRRRTSLEAIVNRAWQPSAPARSTATLEAEEIEPGMIREPVNARSGLFVVDPSFVRPTVEPLDQPEAAVAQVLAEAEDTTDDTPLPDELPEQSTPAPQGQTPLPDEQEPAADTDGAKAEGVHEAFLF